MTLQTALQTTSNAISDAKPPLYVSPPGRRLKAPPDLCREERIVTTTKENWGRRGRVITASKKNCGFKEGCCPPWGRASPQEKCGEGRALTARPFAPLSWYQATEAQEDKNNPGRYAGRYAALRALRGADSKRPRRKPGRALRGR